LIKEIALKTIEEIVEMSRVLINFMYAMISMSLDIAHAL